MKPARDLLSFCSLALGAIALALSGAGVVASLVQFWGTDSNYADRFVILLGAGWAVWNCHGGLPRSPGNLIGLPLILIGMAAAPPAWYLAVQVGPRTILLWWLAGSWVIAASGAVLILGGWPWLRVLAFPLAFVLLALPIPERIELPLQYELQRVTTTVAEWGLSALGFPVLRRGFELHLPGGGLEVVEACSGVRSITALLAIAVFVAHVRGFGLIRGLLMLALALPVIAAVNALRIILTGLIQETIGRHMIEGTPHEVLGVVMVLVGLGMVLLLSQVLRPRGVNVPAPAPGAFPGLIFSLRFLPACIILVVGLVGSAYAYLAGQARVTRHIHTAPLEQLPLEINGWIGQDKEIDPETRALLTYDRAICRVYKKDFEHDIIVFVIYWQASTAVRGYHHPDVCFPNRGWTRIREDVHELEFDAQHRLPVTIRHFEQGRERQRLWYWTQEGKRVWSERDEANADKSGPGHNWIRDRLVENPPDVSARLTVIIQTKLTGGSRGERMLDEFTRQFASQLYEVCPWAKVE